MIAPGIFSQLNNYLHFAAGSVELVNFATEDQTTGDVYSQHQRTARPLSSSVMTPPSSASKYWYVGANNMCCTLQTKLCNI